MSWGPCFLYYRCPDCGKQFKCAVDMIPVLGDSFGKCPVCGADGAFVKEGARTTDDQDYEEVED